ncbi:hypothetical protein J437_LFUL005618 [Ladona fulva]|uniref:Uncharacterized protein n=1 Tax=Ladona fulva TaxID=123851 RepID=A0A8K0K008_LADFU|nr:hypothetical protein J437_LFUL005618 [Ladona fulva]
MLTRGVCHLHDNARPKTVHLSFSTFFGWDIVANPTFSLRLAHSNFHLSTKLKDFLGRKNFSGNKEAKGTVEKWLREVKCDVFDTGIQNLAPRLQKCINMNATVKQLLYQRKHKRLMTSERAFPSLFEYIQHCIEFESVQWGFVACWC